MRVVVTGASGFVGQGLLGPLLQAGHQVTAVSRDALPGLNPAIVLKTVTGLDAGQDWQEILAGQERVIHCAARVHVMDDRACDPLTEYRRVNVAGTLDLARQAAAAGVGRFVFISTVKVNGEQTIPGQPYAADDIPAPVAAYGLSKLEAEQGLQALCAATGMELVIIRPVLVYGPGVKANFRSMMKWLYRGIPLPLGAIDNRRSLVALTNLADLIVTCVAHPSAANQVLLVSDGEDLSTADLLHRLGRALGRPAHLLPVPPTLLETGARLLGKAALAQRLCGSLQVDIGKTRALLGWNPPLRVEAALHETARHFLEHEVL
ncbi:UDP-glucose 4-epimerase family protein [Azomonas macrocytogenes]|uniref:UDP-glucose 4-epimerase n=1 Tax=Azomonas macrocytogenes TaxID=69962 RepID=A0A839T216_AZOMA|nr:SDR family oxidoreductase [Azomonas macrocytogenes]MBB3102670.1 UDP-glucose 4-epimerase [Azomonas macrocytogenes]